jgi:hypothetical protein
MISMSYHMPRCAPSAAPKLPRINEVDYFLLSTRWRVAGLATDAPYWDLARIVARRNERLRQLRTLFRGTGGRMSDARFPVDFEHLRRGLALEAWRQLALASSDVRAFGLLDRRDGGPS